jgi:hypothetical protein
MKRLISLILFLTMVVILIGCAGADRTKPYLGAKGNWTNEVGNATFVGDHSHTGPGVQYQRQLAVEMITP